MKKAFFVFGTRPEAIKMAPVIKEFCDYPTIFKPVVCVTAQHRQMLDEVLDIFDITPQYDLNIMRKAQSPFEVTQRILAKLRNILEDEKPDIVLVQGDTTTTFASALASFYLKIPVGHIEAGLRTFDKYQPFPEEINRRLVSQLAAFHFVPTPKARENLINEGISSNVFITGNTIVDALCHILKRRGKRRSFILPKGIKDKKIILVTAHRRENFGKPLRNICQALKQIASNHNDVAIFYPVHPNPAVLNTVKKELSGVERIYLSEPLGYLDFVEIMGKASIILTDSGGVQEEAPSLGKPVLILREKTEREEIIEHGLGKLVGTSVKDIVEDTESLLKGIKSDSPAMKNNPFGDGKASKRILKILKEKL